MTSFIKTRSRGGDGQKKKIGRAEGMHKKTVRCGGEREGEH